MQSNKVGPDWPRAKDYIQSVSKIDHTHKNKHSQSTPLLLTKLLMAQEWVAVLVSCGRVYSSLAGVGDHAGEDLRSCSPI